MTGRKMGIFQAIGTIAGGIARFYIGYKLGSDAVDYAKTLTSPDTLGYILREHPTLTTLVSTLSVAGIGGEVGAVPGSLLDKLFNTRIS